MLTLLLALGAAPLPMVPVEPAPAVRDAVDDLIAEGKAKLVARDAAGALDAFRRAHDASGGDQRTLIWVLRGRLAKGDLAAFEEAAALEAEGAEGPAIDYLIGAGRYALAKADEAKGGGKAGNYFDEAAAYLADATAADGGAFPDAWRMLAESSRWVGRTEQAASAVGRALEQEKSAQTLALASKIRVARGAELLGSDEAAGKRMVQQGVDDAAAAAKALGDDKRAAAALADAHLQRALGLLFLGAKDDAAAAYVEALAWDPTQADFGQIMGSLRGDDGDRLYIETLKKGAKAFAARWGAKINSDAALHWWLGYAQHFAGDYADSIASFEMVLAKFPSYTNSHWYIGLNHYRTGLDGVPAAAEAWKTYAKIDPAGFAQTLASDPTGAVGGAIGALYGNGRGGAGMETAAELAELVAAAKPQDAQAWNNLGLMTRDAGAWVSAEKPKERKKSPEQYWERSWEAYSRAMELERRPEYVNDGAVLLHYYLERDYDKALAMYDEAEQLAEEWLANRELEDGERTIVETALRDAKDNRAKLKRKIERGGRLVEPDGAR